MADTNRPGGTIGAEEALAFLARVSEILARSLDYEVTLAEVARLAVPELADWCAVDVLEEDGSLRQITSGHPDPELERLLMELRRRFRVETAGDAGVARVIRTGEPELVTDVASFGSSRAAIEITDAEQAVYQRLAPRSYIIVPLVARGRTLGALTLLSTREGRHYTDTDLDFAMHLSRRFGLAIDNAHLFQEMRAAGVRSSFLVKAGEILASSLDYQQTLRNVAQLAVPDISDWCAIQLVNEDGDIEQVAVAHADPAKERYAWELSERFPADPDAPSGVGNVIRTGETEEIPDITDELIDALVPDEEQKRIIRELGLKSSVLAPLRAHGRTFGAITFVSAESGRRFGPRDVELVEELARRAGVAVENSRLYTESTRIAHTLQAELLPSHLPDVPHMDIAVSYRAAGELNEVGGDFYDVFQASKDEWLVVVGDVSGKGAEAAGATALSRYTLHAAALQTNRPSQLLDTLNSALLTQREGRDFCTVCLAIVWPQEDCARVTLSLGGHPSPILVSAEGETRQVGENGTLLGMFAEPHLVDTEVVLHPGEALLFYTDGVIEAGRPRNLLGEVGLTNLLADRGPQTAADIVATAEAAALEAQGGPVRDDIALVAVRLLDRVGAATGGRERANDGTRGKAPDS